MRFKIAVFVIATLLLQGSAFAESGSEESNDDTTLEQFRDAHQDFFRLLTGEGKDIELRHLMVPKSESESGNGRFGLQQESFYAEVPVPVTRDLFFRFAPGYDARFFNFSNVELLGQNPGQVTFHRVVLGGGLGYFFNDSWFATGKFEPALLSDLDGGIDHEDVQYHGQGVMVYQYERYAQVVAGVISDRLFQGTDVYPVLALRARSPNKKWHLKLTPPVDARLGYQLNPSDQLYLSFWQTGDDYRAFFEDANARFTIRIEDRHLGAGLLHWIDDHWNFSFEIGAVIASKFDFKIDRADVPDEHTDPAVYSFFSLGYAL